MHPMTAGLLAIALALGLSTSHAGQQEEIDALKQEVSRLTQRVAHHEIVNVMVQEILDQVQETLKIQVELNTTQADINKLVVDRLLQL